MKQSKINHERLPKINHEINQIFHFSHHDDNNNPDKFIELTYDDLMLILTPDCYPASDPRRRKLQKILWNSKKERNLNNDMKKFSAYDLSLSEGGKISSHCTRTVTSPSKLNTKSTRRMPRKKTERKVHGNENLIRLQNREFVNKITFKPNYVFLPLPIENAIYSLSMIFDHSMFRNVWKIWVLFNHLKRKKESEHRNQILRLESLHLITRSFQICIEALPENQFAKIKKEQALKNRALMIKSAIEIQSAFRGYLYGKLVVRSVLCTQLRELVNSLKTSDGFDLQLSTSDQRFIDLCEHMTASKRGIFSLSIPSKSELKVALEGIYHIIETNKSKHDKTSIIALTSDERNDIEKIVRQNDYDEFSFESESENDFPICTDNEHLSIQHENIEEIDSPIVHNGTENIGIKEHDLFTDQYFYRSTNDMRGEIYKLCFDSFSDPNKIPGVCDKSKQIGDYSLKLVSHNDIQDRLYCKNIENINSSRLQNQLTRKTAMDLIFLVLQKCIHKYSTKQTSSDGNHLYEENKIVQIDNTASYKTLRSQHAIAFVTEIFNFSTKSVHIFREHDSNIQPRTNNREILNKIASEFCHRTLYCSFKSMTANNYDTYRMRLVSSFIDNCMTNTIKLMSSYPYW